MTIFSVIVAFGSVLGLIWTVMDTPKAERQILLTAGVWALGGALIGGRIAYIAVHWAYFQSHIIEIAQIWVLVI